MKTDDLISMMATSVAPIDAQLPRRRMLQAVMLGMVAALILMLLVYGLRPDLRNMLVTPLFWIKLAFPTTVAVGAFQVLRRLLRPGLRIGRSWAALAAPGAAVWIAAALVLAGAPAAERLGMILGVTWRSCPFNIALLSIPLCITLTWAVRAMAPTRLRLTGAATGLLAGALATMVYCLHCPEMEVPFWGVWYLLGMLIPAGAGWLLGGRLLRW